MKTSKRDLIIDSAVKVIAEKGYQYTTTQSIAREAGVSKGLIHFYFENKLDLLLSIFLLFLQKINSINQEKLSFSGDPVDKLKSVFVTFLDLLFQDKKSLYWGKLINERLPQADSIKSEALQKKRRAIVNENKKLVNCIDELIQDGQRKGMITTTLKPQVLRQIFGGSSQMLTWRMYLQPAPKGHPEYDKDDVQSAMDTLIDKFTGRGGYMIVEFFMSDVDIYTHEGKAERAGWLAENAAVFDMACLCSFNFVPVELVPELLSAVVGNSYSVENLRATAQRVITLERKFNIREGFSRKDETLPPRLLNEPLPEGMAEGRKVEGLDIMLDEYYAMRGWDKEGNPPD